MGGFGGDIRPRVEQRVPERGLVARRELALDLATGRRRGELVELVEQPRDRVGALGIEVDRVVRPRGAGTGSGAAPAAPTSAIACAAAPRPFDVDIFLPPMLRNSYGTFKGGSRSNTSRAIASDRSREPPAVARSLPFGSIVTPNSDHWAAHSRFQRQLRAAAERRDPAALAAATRPLDELRPAFVEDPLAVPVGHDRRADLAAVRADDADRVPRVGVLDVGHAPVDVADERSAVQRRPDERVHLPGRVDVAHPVVAVGVDAEPGERVDEGLRRWWRAYDAWQSPTWSGTWASGRPISWSTASGVRQRLGVHRVEVVHAVEQRRRDVVRAQRAGDRVEDDRPPKAADVDRPRGRLGVVDDLRTRVTDPQRELVGPILRPMARGASPRPSGGRGLFTVERGRHRHRP